MFDLRKFREAWLNEVIRCFTLHFQIQILFRKRVNSMYWYWHLSIDIDLWRLIWLCHLVTISKLLIIAHFPPNSAVLQDQESDLQDLKMWTPLLSTHLLSLHDHVAREQVDPCFGAIWCGLDLHQEIPRVVAPLAENTHCHKSPTNIHTHTSKSYCVF